MKVEFDTEEAWNMMNHVINQLIETSELSDSDRAKIRRWKSDEMRVTSQEMKVLSAKINDDLTYFLGWSDGDDSYPIAAQTWIIAYTKHDDAGKAEALRGFLTYLLTEGQDLAPTIDFAPLPDTLRQKALENIAKIGG